MSDSMEDLDWFDGNEGNDYESDLEFIEIKRETDRAWLVLFEIRKDLSSVEAWLPKSRCSIMSATTISVPEWLIEEKGLENYVIA